LQHAKMARLSLGLCDPVPAVDTETSSRGIQRRPPQLLQRQGRQLLRRQAWRRHRRRRLAECPGLAKCGGTQRRRCITALATVGTGRRKQASICLNLKPRAAASARIITRHAYRNRCKAEEPYCNCGPVNRLSITFVTGGIASAGQGRFSKCNFYFGRRQVQIVARSQPYTR
jgi:hypothetical protein